MAFSPKRRRKLPAGNSQPELPEAPGARPLRVPGWAETSIGPVQQIIQDNICKLTTTSSIGRTVHPKKRGLKLGMSGLMLVVFLACRPIALECASDGPGKEQERIVRARLDQYASEWQQDPCADVSSAEKHRRVMQKVEGEIPTITWLLAVALCYLYTASMPDLELLVRKKLLGYVKLLSAWTWTLHRHPMSAFLTVARWHLQNTHKIDVPQHETANVIAIVREAHAHGIGAWKHTYGTLLQAFEEAFPDV